MGCDIHLHQEVKINGEWHHYRHRSIDRSYKLFALMAGVRNNSKLEPVVQPKGLPEDLTFLTRYDYEENWGSDAHTPSWLDPQEVKQVIERFFTEDIWEAEKWFGYLFGHSWTELLQYPSEMPKGLEDYRFVFWFDC